MPKSKDILAHKFKPGYQASVMAAKKIPAIDEVLSRILSEQKAVITTAERILRALCIQRV